MFEDAIQSAYATCVKKFIWCFHEWTLGREPVIRNLGMAAEFLGRKQGAYKWT